MSAVVARCGVAVEPEKGMPVRDESRRTVTPVFTSGRELDVERGGEVGPLEELVREVARHRPAAEAGADADRAVAEGGVHAPLAGRGVPEAEVRAAPRTRRRPRGG